MRNMQQTGVQINTKFIDISLSPQNCLKFYKLPRLTILKISSNITVMSIFENSMLSLLVIGDFTSVHFINNVTCGTLNIIVIINIATNFYFIIKIFNYLQLKSNR